MNKTLIRAALAAGLGAVLVSNATALAADNWLGTWKLNVAKSKFVPGPPPQAMTIKFEPAADGGIRFTGDGVNGEGQPTHLEYAAKFDGTDVRWTGNPNADSASPRRLDANRYENVWKKDGKAVVTVSATVSADGKTLTIIQRGKDAKGQVMDMTEVFEKQ
jgi:hypothetical protein